MSKKAAAAKHTTEAHNKLVAVTNHKDINKAVLDNVKSHASADEFAKSGKEQGREIWRVENFKLVPVPKENHGKFYDGDSYLVLDTIKGSDGKTHHTIHFWLGTNTSQDEAGAAAIKAVELDDKLGKEPIEFREVQGSESRQFVSYFPHGIIYLSGGVKSGFSHVTEEKHTNRLLQLKGKKSIRVLQVPLQVKSLNQGDAFVLDAGQKIYTWFGTSAGVFEKVKAGEIARALDTDRKGKPEIINVSGEGDAHSEEFFKLLEGNKSEIESAEEGGSDLESDKEHQKKKLFKLSDASGSLTFTAVAEGDAVKRDLLTSDDVYIFDTGYEVYAWVGKNASMNERTTALSHAQEYLTKNSGGKTDRPVARVVEGGENPAFTQAFVPNH